MQTAGRPPPYRVYDAAVSNVRTKPMGFLAVAGCCPHTAVCSCRVSGVLSPGAGVAVINSSTGLYAVPAFNSVSVFALHRRLKRAVCCSFGLGALRQSCFSCSLRAASSVLPCAVALAVGADLLCGCRSLYGCRSLCGRLHVQAGAAYTLRQAPGLTLAGFMRLLVRGKCAVILGCHKRHNFICSHYSLKPGLLYIGWPFRSTFKMESGYGSTPGLNLHTLNDVSSACLSFVIAVSRSLMASQFSLFAICACVIRPVSAASTAFACENRNGKTISFMY